MTERVQNYLDFLRLKEYVKERTKKAYCPSYDAGFKESTADFAQTLRTEEAVLYDGDIFGFNRSTDCKIPERVGNLTPNYGMILSQGLSGAAETVKDSMAKTADIEKLEYGRAMLSCIDSVSVHVEKYKKLAKNTGNIALYEALRQVPQNPPRSFYEACVFMKLITFYMRLDGINHLTLGRFDQYMYPYFRADLKKGVTREELLEICELFFVSLNIDSDLFTGIQLGDNGQSMVLGGFDLDGNDMFNGLSEVCIDAALELRLIDPKINLRVGKNTPIERYEYATHLTKAGLGFPQYCNDDVVVEGLVKLGYDREDAVDYTVAACWEYIIPGKGSDIPNYSDLDFPKTVNEVICEELALCETFDELMNRVEKGIIRRCDEIIETCGGFYRPPHPFFSLFFDGCMVSLTDVFSGGVKYNNYGSHGSGISCAADSLAAVKKLVYDEKSVDKTTLLDALGKDFDGYAELRQKLLSCPKMGNNDDYVDSIACFIMSVFADNLNGRPNGNGGIWRAGTGSAHGYIFLSRNCGATADGRKAGMPYASSFSPAPGIHTDGLLSVIQSFTKFDMANIINGGPLTVEVHDSVLRNNIGIEKTALLVKTFIDLGGHQLQLNSVNRETLLDAQKHPENYPNLIVRVWGWSGYFNELDIEFQNHIISRTEYK